MLKREDLERIVGVRTDMDMAPKDLYPNYPDPALLAAAPALALACLDAITGLEPHLSPCLETTKLREALKLAGVEAPE